LPDELPRRWSSREHAVRRTLSEVPVSKIAVIAKLTAAPGKRDDLVAVLTAQVAAVNDEAGTEIYALLTSNDDDTSVYFFERYTDADALKAHSTSDGMKALGPKLKGLVAAAPEIIRLTPVAAKGI
jgi:quinol monooxygenase YgiN